MINKRINYIFLFFILLWTLALRIYFWPDNSISNFGYFEALENHFWEYILKTGQKPPLMYFIQALLINIFGAENIFSEHLMIILVILLDFISFIMIFYILMITNVSLFKSSMIILFYSFYQIPIEFWRLGLHYDSFSLFFNTLFIFNIAFFIKKQNINRGLLMSISGCLLVLYGSIYFIVVPMTIVFCVLCTMLKKFNFYYFLKICCLLLILPIITATSICYKNYIYRNVFAPSTFGGVALMLTTMRTVDRNIVEGNKIVEKSSAPHWYKWCWKNADKFLTKEAKGDYIALVNNKVFGQCLKYIPHKGGINSIKTAHISHINNKDFWPFDMSELKEYFSRTNSKEALDAVNKDIDMMKNKKYLIFGMSPELSLHWTDLYGKEGGKIFWEDFSNNPVRYFKTFFRLFTEFTIDGSRFPLVMSMFNDRSQAFKHKFANKYFMRTLTFLGIFLQCVMLITFTSYCFLFIKLLIYINSKKNIPLNDNNIKTLFFGFPAILITILYSIIVGEENSRYLIYAIPYFTLSFVYILPKNILQSINFLTMLKK